MHLPPLSLLASTLCEPPLPVIDEEKDSYNGPIKSHKSSGHSVGKSDYPFVTIQLSHLIVLIYVNVGCSKNVGFVYAFP